MFRHVKDQLLEVRDKIASLEKSCGRRPGEVRLVAVSKTFPPEAVLAAYDAGQRLFGENRVQELESKKPVLPSDVEWHLIGHLQGNKAAKALECAAWIHSVDSAKLFARLDRLAGETGARPKVLLEINVSGEESKFGISAEKDAMFAAGEAVRSKNLIFSGLMTMAPLGAAETELGKIFSGLRDLRDKIQSEYSVTLPELSMGMSSDYEIAIREGATLVRVGSAIFGKRSVPLHSRPGSVIAPPLN